MEVLHALPFAAQAPPRFVPRQRRPRPGSSRTQRRGQQGGRGGFPAPGRHPDRLRFRPAEPAARSLSRHVFRGQRERPAAPGGAAEAGGRRGEDQGERLPSRTPAPAPPPTEGHAGGRGRAEVAATGPGARRGLGCSRAARGCGMAPGRIPEPALEAPRVLPATQTVPGTRSEGSVGVSTARWRHAGGLDSASRAAGGCCLEMGREATD